MYTNFKSLISTISLIMYQQVKIHEQILTCKVWLQAAVCCKAWEEGVLRCGFGGAADPPFEWAFRKFWHWGLAVGLETWKNKKQDWINSFIWNILTIQGLLLLANTTLTCGWAITLDGTFWYLEEIQRALTGTGRDCALSASCSLQRLWISLSRRTFSLPKSGTCCSERTGIKKVVQKNTF